MGEIPNELGSLTNLELLGLHDNALTGGIPPELGRLTNLVTLALQSNNLTGGIPPELGRLTNLRTLSLRSNNLTDGIPPELGRLTNLEWLYLHTNNLTGEIPPELVNLTDIRFLYLHTNNLTGTIPYELRRFAGEGDINPQRGGVILPVGTPVPALPFVGALLLACGLWCIGRRRQAGKVGSEGGRPSFAACQEADPVLRRRLAPVEVVLPGGRRPAGRPGVPPRSAGPPAVRRARPRTP